MAGQPAKMVGLHNIIVRLFMVGRFSWCAKRRNVEKWENKSEKYHGDENILPSSSPPLLLDENRIYMRGVNLKDETLTLLTVSVRDSSAR